MLPVLSQQSSSQPLTNDYDPSDNISDPDYVVRPSHCPCSECRQQYRTMQDQLVPDLRYDQVLGDEEAEELVHRLAGYTKLDREQLISLMGEHGSDINSRWRNLSKHDRIDILQQVDPAMSSERWPEGSLPYEYRHSNCGLETRHLRDTWLLPYINLDSLSEGGETLIDLFRNRTIHAPEHWVQHDSAIFQFPWYIGAFSTAFNLKAVYLLAGKKFGSLVEWDADLAHEWVIVGFPRALLILEAQAKLMNLLLRLARNLYKSNIPNSELVSEPLLPQVDAPGVLHDGSPLFDLEKLEAICQGRLDLCADHIKELQTNPEYLRRYIKLLTKGRGHELAQEELSEVQVLTAMDLDHDLWTLRHWEGTIEQLQSFKRIRSSVGSLVYGQRPPKYLEKMLAAFEFLVVTIINNQSLHLRAVLPQRPGFAYLYEQVYESGVLQIQRKKALGVPENIALAEMFVTDPLDWCLGCLTGFKGASGKEEPSRLLEFLHSHLQTSTKEASRVDETLYRKISDLAAFHEILIAVRNHRPRAKWLQYEENTQASAGLIWKYFLKGANSSYGYLEAAPLDWTALGKHLGDFLSLRKPSDPKDRKWLAANQEIRKSMQRYWIRHRLSHKTKLRKFAFSEEEINKDINVWSFDLSQHQAAAVEVEYQGWLALVEAGESAATENQPKKHKKRNKKGKGSQRKGPVDPEEGASLVSTSAVSPTEESNSSTIKSSTAANSQAVVDSSAAIPSSVAVESAIFADSLTVANLEIRTAEPQAIVPSPEEQYDEAAQKEYFQSFKDKKGKGKQPDARSALDKTTTEQIQSEFDQNGMPVLRVKQKFLTVFSALFLGDKSIRWEDFLSAMAAAGFVASRVSGGSAVGFAPLPTSRWFGLGEKGGTAKGGITIHRPHPQAKLDPIILKAIGSRLAEYWKWHENTFILDA